MRSDKQKLTGKQKDAATDQHRDPEARRKPKVAAKTPAQARTANGLAHVRRQDEKTGHTLH